MKEQDLGLFEFKTFSINYSALIIYGALNRIILSKMVTSMMMNCQVNGKLMETINYIGMDIYEMDSFYTTTVKDLLVFL